MTRALLDCDDEPRGIGHRIFGFILAGLGGIVLIVVIAVMLWSCGAFKPLMKLKRSVAPVDGPEDALE